MCWIDSGSKNCPYIKKNHCSPKSMGSSFLYCEVSQSLDFASFALYIPMAWFNMLPYLFSVNLEIDLEAWSNKSSMSLSQNSFIGSAAYTYKESMSCLRVSVFVMRSIYYCLDPSMDSGWSDEITTGAIFPELTGH